MKKCPLRIISWNCRGKFREKFHYLEKLNADILIIQECENPRLTLNRAYKQWASNYLWTRRGNKNKGLGIFCKAIYKIKRNDWKTGGLQYFISAKINNKFNLLAVWNHRGNLKTPAYIGQFWEYLSINKRCMKRIIIAGDFNSSALWDASHVGNSHSDVVMELKKMGIRSLYHEYRKEKQGEELLMTHWNRRRSYHIDYIFADKQFFKSVTGIHIGKRSVWKDRSDHVPLIADLKIDKSVGKGK